MAKNMTRKGLALATAASLAVIGLTAAPAQANSALITELDSGTSFNSVTGYANELTLTTAISATYQAVDGDLSYRIGNAGAGKVDLLAGNVLGSEARADNTNGKLTEYDDSTALTDVASAGGDPAGIQVDKTDVVLDLSVGTFVTNPGGNTAGVGNYATENYLKVSVADATTTNYTITVQAWLDTNSNQKIDGTEVSGNVVTLVFYDETNIAATTTLVSPVLGADNVQATITTNPELNGQQLGSDFIDVDWTTQNNANAVLAENSFKIASKAATAGSTTYNGTTKRWTSTFFLPYALKSDPFSGSAITYAQVNLVTAAPTPGTFAIDGAGTATITTNAHGLTAGQVVLVAATAAGAATPANELDGVFELATAPTNSITFAVGGTTNQAAAALTNTSTLDLYGVKSASTTVVANGSYSARPFIGARALGSAVALAEVGTTADDIKAAIAGTVNIIGSSNSDGGSETGVNVRKGTTTLPITATVFKSDGTAVGAGVPVTVTLTTEAGSGTLRVDGVASPAVVYTNASGAIAINVTTTTAAAADSFDVTLTPQSLTGAKTAKFDFLYADAAYDIVELGDVQAISDTTEVQRSANNGASVPLQFVVLDQWKQKLTGDKYRLQVVASTRTSATLYDSLSDGEGSFSIADGALSTTTTGVAVTVQELASSVWGAPSSVTVNAFTALTINYYNQTDKVTLNADGTSSADLAVRSALTAAAASDTRQSTTAAVSFDSVGTNSDETATITGTIAHATTNVAKVGAMVTVTGSADILFNVGAVSSFGSISFYDADGSISVNAYSNKKLKDSVVTVASGAASSTVKVSFTPGGTNLGKTLTITAPTSVAPGSTLQVSALLTDAFGSGVDTDISATDWNDDTDTTDAGETSTNFSVSVSGPGISIATAPTATDADGVASVFRLLGQNDSGSITITVSYDQNDDGDYSDSTDLVKTATVSVGTPEVVAKVGSFSGRVAVRVENAKGSIVSVKVGKQWYKYSALNNNYLQSWKSRKGTSVAVSVYVDGELQNVQTITVK